MWRLTRDWYGDRLAPEFRPKAAAELQEVLTGVGLVSDFWQLG